MNFGTRSRPREAGKALGFFLGYELFFTVLFILTSISGKFPQGIGYPVFISAMTAFFLIGKGASRGLRHG